MRQFSLLDEITEKFKPNMLPEPFDPVQAAQSLGEWQLTARDLDLGDLATAAEQPIGHKLLSAIFGNSPYLGNCLIRDVPFSDTLLSQSPDTTLSGILERLNFSEFETASVADLMKALRQKKHQIAVLTAVADISGLWSLDQVTAALSDFAQRALQLAVSRLLVDQAALGQIFLPSLTEPCRGSGYTILGMGKLGARELNYSSDIDLIVLYDDETVRYTGDRSLGECMVRLTRDLVRIMQERTGDGYVFRTDLRLRPDPRATPAALNMAAAENYYESTGLNWERAAMIKARPVAGDLAVGEEFIQRISPFVWRKHLDFAAVQDIHAIKHQIHRHHGHGAITVAGHDVKLGRGGIREIEFTAQAHQLLLGGREPMLRSRRTCETLKTLAETGKLDADSSIDLITSYTFLRTLEHRLQMVNDEQTHDLPETPEGIAHIACFMGFDTSESFAKHLLHHLETVQKLYERLFEDEVPESNDALARVVTAAEADIEAQETLLALGFVQSPRALEIVHGWGLAPYRAMRYERARDLLADLVPTILTALSKTAEPDRALVRFDEFLRGLPEGVQLFSLLHANAWLLDLLAEIMGSAPRLAVLLGHNAGLLDAVLDTNFYEPLPSASTLYEDLERTLQRARDYQDVLDLARSWSNEHRFQVGVQILRCTVAPEQAGRSQSDLADVVIRALLPKVEAEFAHLHGRIPEAEIAVLALGKLGGRELTVTSDLDLIFLYEIGGPEISDGEKPLPAGTYFARLSQRFINALTALTGEGRLYEVDMRLRPSGRGGPIAQTIDGFAKYHGEQAWTWEHMALTRARVVAASPVLTKKIDTLILSVLSVPRDPVKLVTDVAEMREKLRREFGSDDIWRVKHVRGGLLDVEFIAQYLQLKSAGGNPIVFYQNTCEALEHLQLDGHLNIHDAEVLLTGFRLFTAIQSLVRLCTENGFVEDTAPLGLKEALATAGGAANFTNVKQRLREAESAVYRCFEKLISQPADRYLDSGENEGPESHG